MNSTKKRILAFVISICFLFCSSSYFAYADETTTAVNQEEAVTEEITIEEAQAQLEEKRKELEQSLKESQEKLEKFSESEKVTGEYIESLDEKIGYLNEELTLLDKEVQQAGRKVEVLTEEINTLAKDIDKIQKEYDKANDELTKLQDSFVTTKNAYCLRLRAMYISGTNSIIVALLTSKDISQLFSRYEMIKAITKSDTALMNEVNRKIAEITEQNAEILGKKTQLESDKSNLDEKQTQLLAEQHTIERKQKEMAEKKIVLATNRAESDSLLAQYQSQTKMYSEYKYEDEELIKLVDEEINAILSGQKDPSEMKLPELSDIEKNPEVPNETSPLYYKSNAVLNMTYPAPGYYTVSENFGYYKNGGKHTGIDFPYPMGTKVVAAQKGIVVTAKSLKDATGKYYSYGKYIIIYHGTDAQDRKIYTLYAHNSALNVSVGQTVKKGQKIAEGGSTGNSTGPHCHFEVIINNEKVNPANYLSK